MKLSLNLPNYDLGFHFCVHEATISQPGYIYGCKAFQSDSLARERGSSENYAMVFRPHYGLQVSSIIVIC